MTFQYDDKFDVYVPLVLFLKRTKDFQFLRLDYLISFFKFDLGDLKSLMYPTIPFMI